MTDEDKNVIKSLIAPIIQKDKEKLLNAIDKEQRFQSKFEQRLKEAIEEKIIFHRRI